MSKLANKVALVTGASKGIGASIAKHLAAAGATVAVNYATSKDGADATVAAITKAGGKAFAVQGDIAKPDDVKRVFADVKERTGRLDILVNNAGVYEYAPLDQVTPESFHRQFDLNVLGLILASKEAAALFGADGGSIINIGSAVATMPPVTGTVYSATKAAVDNVTIALSKELGPRKIRVNALNPGLVKTEGSTSAGFDSGDFADMAVRSTPLGRIGTPDDIGPVAVFLACEDARWVTGQRLVVGGGVTF